MVKGSNIISNIIWKFAERILAQIVTLIVSIVLARILLPEDYGAISMVMVFIAIANVFVVEGIPSALIQKKNADSLDFSSVFYFNLFVSIFIYVIVYISAPYIAIFYNNPVLEPVMKVLGIRLIVAAMNSVQHAYVSRNMLFKKYFWSTLFGTILSGGVGIAMAYAGFGVWALVAQYMVNTSVDTIVLFVTVNWRPKVEFNFTRVKVLFSFGWRMLFEGVSNAIGGQIRNLIIGKIYSSSDLAYYTKGQQFPSLIVSNITTSIGSVLFPAIANEQEDSKHVLIILRKSVRFSSYVVYPMLMGLAITASTFIRLILTEKWMDTVPFLQVFCFLHAPTVGMIPRHQALNGTGRSDIFMNEHLIARVISLVLLLLTYKISVLAIVMSSIVSTIILTFIIAYTSKTYNGYSYKDQFSDIFPTVVGCIIMGVAVYPIKYIGFTDAVTLAAQVLCGIVIYIIYSIILKLEEFSICKNYLQMLIRLKNN